MTSLRFLVVLVLAVLVACEQTPSGVEDAGTSPRDATTGCTSDDDCDDGQYCNGAETCDESTCASGEAPCRGECDEAGDA